LEDPALSAGGVAHDGGVAESLGLKGWPPVAESAMAFRDVAILHDTGGRLHFAHVSSVGTLEAVSWARRAGLSLTAEAAPHHLFLTDEALRDWSGAAVSKVNPPLRPAAIRDALRQAVADGLISVVASDHAPHTADEKREPFERAPFGISGVETVVGVLVTVFLQSGMMRPLDLFARLTTGPHHVISEACRGVLPGAAADFVLIDPAAEWVVDSTAFESRGRNTPLNGHRLVGRVMATVRRGRVVYREGVVVDG
jgi:dihydroorotase